MSGTVKHITHGMKQPKKAMESTPAPAAAPTTKTPRKWRKETKTKRSIAQIRKRPFMFLHKNFGVIVRAAIAKHNNNEGLKVESGVTSAIQKIVEARLIDYLKTTHGVCMQDNNRTLMGKHLNIMSIVLGLSPNYVFGKVAEPLPGAAAGGSEDSESL